MIPFWWSDLKQELNWVIVWFLWAIMWEGWKRVLLYEPLLKGIQVSRLVLFFYFRLLHKNKTKGQLEQFKKNYSRSVVPLHPHSALFSSYSLVIYGDLSVKKGAWNFTMLSIKPILLLQKFLSPPLNSIPSRAKKTNRIRNKTVFIVHFEKKKKKKVKRRKSQKLETRKDKLSHPFSRF